MTESNADGDRKDRGGVGHQVVTGLARPRARPGQTAPVAPAGPVPPPAAAMRGNGPAPGQGQAGAAPANPSRVRMSVDKAFDLALSHYHAGRLAQAEGICVQIVEARPKHALAHNLLGALLLGKGDAAAAAHAFRRAVRLDQDNAQFQSNLGEAERRRGRFRDAGVALARAVELNPRSPQAHNNLGILNYDREAYDAAEADYRRAIALAKNYPEAQNNLGNALRMLGRREEAVDAYQQALLQREKYPEAYNNLATVLRELGQSEESEHAYRKAIELQPGYLDAYVNLALMLSAESRYDEALRALGRALEIAPRHVPTLVAIARAQMKKANHHQAEQAARVALAIDPDNAVAQATLGEIFLDNDRFTEALAAFEGALSSAPDSWETRNLYANCLKAVGRLDDALAQFERTLSDNPRAYGCYANMADLVTFTRDSPHFEAMERILAEASEPDSAPFMSLHFAIGKAYDDVGDYPKAIAHWRTGATLRRKDLDYDETETANFFAGIMASYGADYFAGCPFEGNPSAAPVFIIGMPRSGSTLVEQILTSHPLIHGGGETKELSRRLGALRARFPGLPRYPELGRRMNADQHRIVADGYLSVLQGMNPDAARITDKLLTNYYFVGLLHVLFPNARFINTVRNPIDACISCYSKLFRDDMPHSYDFGELGRYYLRYQALMDHWRRVLPAGTMLSVQYEDVVADVEAQARRLIDFVGLPWDSACLAFHQSARPVKTASVVQVRQPVYQTSVERWRRYGTAIQPLIDALCVNEDTPLGLSGGGGDGR